jgi:hypothetical protein
MAAIGRSGETRGEWTLRMQRERDRNARAT